MTAASGRMVTVVSIGFPVGWGDLDAVAELVEREAEQPHTDIVALPETWMGQEGHEPEDLSGPTITRLAEIAANKGVYVVAPLDRIAEGRRYNSAVLLERDGSVACVYDKVYPFWSEFEVDPPVTPGSDAPVYQADFGRVGMAICFDANFPPVWRRLAEQNCEVVIWPSAYSAGTQLQAQALNYHYYVVSVTRKADCVVYDINGRELHYERGSVPHVSRLCLDLDRGIYHLDYNTTKRDRLLAEHGDEIELEEYLEREAWFVLRARRSGISVRALAREYGLEELRHYKLRSERAIDAMRE